MSGTSENAPFSVWIMIRVTGWNGLPYRSSLANHSPAIEFRKPNAEQDEERGAAEHRGHVEASQRQQLRARRALAGLVRLQAGLRPRAADSRARASARASSRRLGAPRAFLHA